MKIKIVSDCFHSGGTPAAEGDILDLPAGEVEKIFRAGRGYPITADEIAKAEASTKAPAAASKGGK
jgi:hypothetical protein